MNVIVANKNQKILNSLDIDVIKSINGEFSVDEIIATFSNFFFNRMFIDITAIKEYMNVNNMQKLSVSLEMNKVIFLLDNILMNDNAYLSKLISLGIYNFASNKESLMYLYNHPNTYKDVASIHQLGNAINAGRESTQTKKSIFGGSSSSDESAAPVMPRTAKVVGFKNATAGAGSTTLIYMIKKVMSEKEFVVAIEVNKNDFGFFNEKEMYSVNQNNLASAIEKFANAKYIFVDINNGSEDLCDEVIYLMEPSTIKLNKMMLVNKSVFDKLYGKKIVLNKSLLTEKDVKNFEFESNAKITFNMPPLNDREKNIEILEAFMDEINEV